MTKTARPRKYFAPQSGNTKRKCDHEGCNKKGEYRAPKDRSLKDYYWFCLEHVKEYNAKWNYYDGISDHEAEEEKKPKMHFKSKIKYQFGFGYEKEFNFFDEYDVDFSTVDGLFYTREEKSYLETMDLSGENLNLKSLKKQYKKLAKKYHPDANHGDKDMEEKFKQLTHAYNHLLKKLS